ncbi:MAG: hypothetical protein OXE87_06930 [Chloroflexi bacterium]|nr:hypothetical protein [Chloroflexota bacterium]
MIVNTGGGPVSGRHVPGTPLRWQAWIDWPGNDSWDPDASDVSADVLALRWRWGRSGLPVPEFAPPANLEFTLRNDHRRYTPGNGNGPLGDNVQPGRAIWLRASRMHDDFSTTNAATVDLDGRTTASGARWDVLSVPGNGFSAADGTVTGQGGGWPPSDAVALLDTGDPLATLMVRYKRGSSGLGGLVLRCVARDDCLRLRFANDATILERVSGRAATRLADGAPLDAGTWYDLEIQQTATSVRVHAVGLGQAGASRREILSATGIIDPSDSPRHGLWHGFRSTQDEWAELAVGRSLFNGRITRIDPDHDAGVCRITAADVMHRLESAPLHRALAGGLMRSGSVAAAILGWAGLLPEDYSLDTGRLLLTGGPRSIWDVSAARALRRLQREEHGFIYADGLGRVRLEAASTRSGIRDHQDPVSLVRFTVRETAGGGGPYATAVRRGDGANAVEDVVTFRYRRSSDSGRQQVWSLNEALEIPAGGEQLVLAATDTWDVISALNTPVAGTDYAATDDAAGAGMDVTDDITIELPTEAESGISGRGHVVRIRNGGANAAYLQSLALYADHCWRAQSSSAVQAPTALSPTSLLTANGRLVNCQYTDNYAAAQGAAEARLGEHSTPRPHLEVALPLLSRKNHRAAIEGSLSDVVAVQAEAHGITGAWLLEGMEINVHGSGDGEAKWWLVGV